MRRSPTVASRGRFATGDAAGRWPSLGTLDLGHATRRMGLATSHAMQLHFVSFLFFIMADTSDKASRPANSDATPSAEPVFKVRFGEVSAAVFADQVETKDGNTFTRHNVSLRRSYRDADSGDWKHTNVLSETDLLPAAEALRHCFYEIAKRK
ncbi:hypothetical protein [Thalassoglobus neptunius]|uniref:hypothetical protein n=1 Tax=Thalassoglobus neptunius TaxID=1938619 RepID=UPI001E4CAC14|nr:hypothetical protein [Thalassoglobus neptunius]